jgi:hypothetical protein
MKLLLLIFVNVIFLNKAFSQNDPINQRKSYGVIDIKFEIGSRRKITKVDVEGNFGADTAVRESIKKSLNTSTSVDRGAKRGTYTARVSFIIDKEGHISDVECIKDPGYGMGAISVRAVKKSTRWGSGPVRPMKPTYAPASGPSDE